MPDEIRRYSWSIARTHQLKVGDHIEIFESPFKVVQLNLAEHDEIHVTAVQWDGETVGGFIGVKVPSRTTFVRLDPVPA